MSICEKNEDLKLKWRHYKHRGLNINSYAMCFALQYFGLGVTYDPLNSIRLIAIQANGEATKDWNLCESKEPIRMGQILLPM